MEPNRCISWVTVEWTEYRRTQLRCPNLALHSARDKERPTLCCEHRGTNQPCDHEPKEET